MSENKEELWEKKKTIERLEKENGELRTFVKLLKEDNDRAHRNNAKWLFESRIASFGETLLFFLGFCVALIIVGTVFYQKIKHGK